MMIEKPLFLQFHPAAILAQFSHTLSCIKLPISDFNWTWHLDTHLSVWPGFRDEKSIKSGLNLWMMAQNPRPSLQDSVMLMIFTPGYPWVTLWHQTSRPAAPVTNIVSWNKWDSTEKLRLKCCVIKIMFYDQIVMIIHLSVHAILEIIFRLFAAAMSDMISEPVFLVKISIETWRSESVKSSSPLLVLLIICPDKPQFPVSGQMIETCSHVISVTDHQLLITGPHHSHQWTRVWPWIRASVGSAPANQNITPSPVDKDKR